MTDVEQLLEKRRNMFIASRRDVEVYIANFFAELDKINPSLLKDTHPVEGRTAQEIFPSLYKEPYDMEEYEKEYARFDAYYKEVEAVAQYLNKKAEEVLNNANSC